MATQKKVGFGSCRYVYIYMHTVFGCSGKWIEMGIRWELGENQGSEMNSHVRSQYSYIR